MRRTAEFLVSAHVTRPGVVTLMEMVATARTGAGALTSEKVGHLLTGQMRGDLDRLLVHDAGLGMTRLTWLTTPAVEATSAAVKMAIEKLLFLRCRVAPERSGERTYGAVPSTCLLLVAALQCTPYRPSARSHVRNYCGHQNDTRPSRGAAADSVTPGETRHERHRTRLMPGYRA